MISFSEKDKTIIGLLTILSGILALACMVVGLIATQFDAEAFANPVSILNMKDISPDQIRWFMLLDMMGYYLLLIPVLFLFHRLMEQKTAWGSMFTSLGFGYILIGAIGAAALAVLWPGLIVRHAAAPLHMREVYRADFQLVTEFVAKGMWNYLEVLLGGIWWIGVGVFTIRGRILKTVTIILGIACLLDGIGEALQVSIVAEIGLNIYLLLGIIWSVWVGVLLIRNKF
ncbi:MAG TPA: hypothetical protein VLC28_10085 [Flavitalea sp.]|nr:hypothetical protein [Flavitalea sp.]